MCECVGQGYISKLSSQLMYTYGDMDKILGKLEGRRRRLETPMPVDAPASSIEIDMSLLDEELALQ